MSSPDINSLKSRILTLKSNYIKELLKLKRPDDKDFSTWYKALLTVADGKHIVTSDINKSLYTLSIGTKTMRLPCPKCGKWYISLRIFHCVNNDNPEDKFLMSLVRCSDIECSYVSDETITPLINKITWWVSEWLISNEKESSPSPMISESVLDIDDDVLYKCNKEQLVNIIKKNNQNKSWLLLHKIVEKPVLLVYAGIFIILLSFWFWFLFKSSWLSANIWKWWITITQKEERVQVQKDNNWARYILLWNEKYINEQDLKLKVKNILNR